MYKERGLGSSHFQKLKAQDWAIPLFWLLVRAFMLQSNMVDGIRAGAHTRVG